MSIMHVPEKVNSYSIIQEWTLKLKSVFSPSIPFYPRHWLLESCSGSVLQVSFHHSSHSSKPWSPHHESDRCDEPQNSAASEMKWWCWLSISTVSQSWKAKGRNHACFVFIEQVLNITLSKDQVYYTAVMSQDHNLSYTIHTHREYYSIGIFS